MKTKVSIVIPVYNAEKYLEQCIESIVNQDVGFTNIELILVNDGSKDGSGKICEKYAHNYPDNVRYIEQKNAGVSEARNAGVRAASGDYIGFMDADDYFSKNVIGSVIEYFDAAPNDVDVAVVRVMQFGYYAAERSINNKFNFGTRTIDLTDPEWHDLYARVAPAFIKSQVAKRHTFNKEIGIYEDTRYISEVLAENMKLGVVTGGTYYNRIHIGDASASITTGAAKEKRFYLDSPEKVSLFLLNKFKEESGYPPIYFQYIALYEMRWRLFHNSHDPRDILSKKEFEKYVKINKSILNAVSDEAIIEFKMYGLSQKLFLLNLKHGVDVLSKAKLNKDNELTWQGKPLLSYEKDMAVNIVDAYLSKQELALEGYLTAPLGKGVEVCFRVDGEERDDLIIHRRTAPTSGDEGSLLYDRDAHSGGSCTIIMPVLQYSESADFTLLINGEEYLIERFSLTKDFRYGYGYGGNYRVSKKIGGFMVSPITTHRTVRRAIAAVRYLLELGRRVLRKVKSICIQTIKTLR